MTTARALDSNRCLLALLVTAVVLLATGCGPKAPLYVEPSGMTDAQLAILTGRIDEINGHRIERETLQEVDVVRVLPGTHSLGTQVTGSKFVFPASTPGFAYVRMILKLNAGHRYHIAGEPRTMGDRIRIENLTTGRVAYLEANRLMYYDEQENLLHHDFSRAFEP